MIDLIKYDNFICCRYDKKKYMYNIELNLQKPIVLQGLYEANGKVLILPIVGNGTCRITLGN